MPTKNEEKVTPQFPKKYTILIFGFLMSIALLFRLYNLSSPIAEWHSWRQADTAAVARNFVSGKFDLLRPRFDDLSNIQSGLYNPQGYRMVEFPIYNAIFATSYKYLPVLPLEVYGRLTTAFFSLILLAIIFIFMKKEHGIVAAFFSGLIFAVFPYFVFYSRAILPDMTSLSLMFMSIFILYITYEKKRDFRYQVVSIVIATLLASLSVLVKPVSAFYLPLAGFIFLRFYRTRIIKQPLVYFYFIVLFIPFILWRQWIHQFPEGIPVFEWLFFQTNTPNGRENIFFRPAFFRWIFHERINNLILGGFLSSALIVGILSKIRKSFFLLTVGLSSLLYLFIFQGGNLQHDYYQIMIIPALVMFCGKGLTVLMAEKKVFTSQIFSAIVILCILAFSWFISYFKVRDYYAFDPNLIRIAGIIKTVTSPGDKIVTDTIGDTTILYLSGRKGYPAVTKDLDEIKKDGLSYFVTMNKSVADEIRKKKNPYFESDAVYIFKL
ncbi:hypothetical protein A3D06_02460 [Candidatus Roizmanbacteria bacterium RIFCSPHIGHO2_02_FULL_40_9]|uniref:Glycosyltransferase RgtA/B/C/D-like domain-containing protein n=2 Tax=Candidatus Roizmaniibacteriota TaxID=1752723 RepID=A0A1F7INK6_9BACT|nr:MAG: hypothetical protein A3D06_02460 [Candidatus Roizmanbacteria bacterium RIFCSPHIGHO2_02_FULL_40_9]OGK44901.1 MAG: hypothetical protein A2957_02685 [Candidatus Roizmanbacteria bacterium RIFCSPLOWO2_01_FULL_38_11]